MSEQSREKLREIQARLEQDSRIVTTRADLVRLRAYWNDIQTVLDADDSTE